MLRDKLFLDDLFATSEQLPREFIMSFKETDNDGIKAVQVILNDTVQIGDIIDDNSYNNDYYRYHDIFHYTFATMLGWSPCSRSLMKCKRKSNPTVDKIEDGARAAITEESISLMVFNEAKKKNFFLGKHTVSRKMLKIIKEITEPYEVNVRTIEEWENAIKIGYNIFNKLITYSGGRVYFNSTERKILYL